MLIIPKVQSCMPGAEPVADPLRVAPVTSPGELLHSLLAVSHAPAPEFLLSVNVAGFLYVSDVDVTRNTARCPCLPVHLPEYIVSCHDQLPPHKTVLQYDQHAVHLRTTVYGPCACSACMHAWCTEQQCA